MITIENIIDQAKLVFRDEKLELFIKDILSEDKRELAHLVITQELFQMEEIALESIHKGDCDFVIFNQYREVKNLSVLNNNYLDKQYAIGT